jgi:cytochrome c peroxidase
VACASCHDPAQGGSDHRSLGATSLGAAWGARNAPTIINDARAEAPWRFWDGRADSLWSQALGPVERAAEMNSSRAKVAQLIVDHYRAPYEALFGPVANDADILFANFGKAVAAYERRLIDQTSPFDRWMNGDASAMPAAAVRGARLFVGRAACNECHRGPLLSDGKFHNHAIPQPEAEDRGRYDGIAEVLADPFNGAGAYADQKSPAHLQDLAPGPLDLGAFKTPTLRNVARRAPYMHDGSLPDLPAVMEHYVSGGLDRPSRSTLIEPLHLSPPEIKDLLAFLASLSEPARSFPTPTLPQ